MTATDLRICFDNHGACDEQPFDLVQEIRVDQAIGMASEADLTLDLALDETGSWSGIDEDFAQPFRRVRVEVKVGSGDYVALIDGPIVAQNFELSAEPDDSKLVLTVQDDSVLLNRNEKVEVYEGQSADQIARRLFQAEGLSAEVDGVSATTGGLTRTVVQRGTAMHLLRELARRHGMFVYVKPGTSAGRSVGVFKRPDLAASDLPEILIVGAERNVNRFSVRFDALRPVTASAGSVRVSDQKVLSKAASESSLDALGEKAAHELVKAGQVLLARTREEEGDLAAAVAAAVDHSGWAWSASGETTDDLYPAVLAPYHVVQVAGAGSHLAGSYLISQVTHTLDDESYRQQFTLRRNARSAGGSSSAATGGVF